MKKQISILVILSQLATGAFATGAFVQSRMDAEATYLVFVNGLAGENLPPEVMVQAQEDATNRYYTASANEEDRGARLEKAMVTLKLASPV